MSPINKELKTDTFFYKPFRYLPEQPKSTSIASNPSTSHLKFEPTETLTLKTEPSVYDGGNWGSNEPHGKSGFGL